MILFTKNQLFVKVLSIKLLFLFVKLLFRLIFQLIRCFDVEKFEAEILRFQFVLDKSRIPPGQLRILRAVHRILQLSMRLLRARLLIRINLLLFLLKAFGVVKLIPEELRFKPATKKLFRKFIEPGPQIFIKDALLTTTSITNHRFTPPKLIT